MSEFGLVERIAFGARRVCRKAGERVAAGFAVAGTVAFDALGEREGKRNEREGECEEKRVQCEVEGNGTQRNCAFIGQRSHRSREDSQSPPGTR